MNELVEKIIYEPWPWWVGGPLIGIFVIALLLIERKQLGISSSYQYVCAKLSPIKLDYFKNVENIAWQFWFAIGLVLGGVIIYGVIPVYQINISPNSIQSLQEIGISPQVGYAPQELYNFSFKSILLLVLGGFFIGFGARYANGCTAGHAIMGCAQLSPASIVSTIGFFIGGLIATHFVLPFIF